MTAAIVVAANGRRHWIAEPAPLGRWRTICHRAVRAISLLPEDDPRGVTCPACRERLAGAR